MLFDTKIPPQLQNPDLRFLCIEKAVPGDPLSGKRPEKGHSWTKPGRNANIYTYNSPGLLGWLRGGRNYGVITAYGNIVVFDADDLSRLKELGANFDQWPETFLVKTGRVNGEGRHFYFYSTDLKEKYIFTDPEKEDPKHPGKKIQLGSLQAGKFYVVAPGSKHNSGGVYTVINDVPIATLTAEQFWRVMNCIPHADSKKGSVGHAKKVAKEPKSKKKVIDSETYENVSSYIKCEDVAMPEPIVKWNGAIAIGSHPIPRIGFG